MKPKQYDKKPRLAGCKIFPVNGKFGIPSEKLIIQNASTRMSRIQSAGNYMSLPKSSWSNTQNSPPQDQSCELIEI